MSLSLVSHLTAGLRALGLVQTALQQEQLIDYLGLLQKWNKAYNLTAIRDPQEMLIKHVFDALSVQAHLPTGGHWIDVGSGGGIPGLILAIVDPTRRWTLLDSNGKKTRFLTQATLDLKLIDRVSVVHARAENHNHRYDGVIARAVTETADFIGFTQHLCKEGGSWWMMKGQYPKSELEQLPPAILTHCIELSVPELAAERWLIQCQRQEAMR